MSRKVERTEVPPRTDLMRQAPFRLRAANDGDSGDGLTLDGYAAVFRRDTLIDSWEGKFWENIAPGAMKKSFREKPPKIQFDHGRHPLIGSIPIARTEIAEESTDPTLAPEGGAHIVGRLFDNWLIEPVRDAIAEQAINGMSFRFSVVREEWRDATGKVIRDEEKLLEALRRTWYEDVPDEELLTRTLKELKVPEAGPVVWPAYEETSVGVRNKVTIDLGRLDDPAQRKTLARAVLLADAATQTDDAPHADADPTQDTQRETSPAAPSEDRSEPSEHPSTKPTGNPAKEFAKHARGYLLKIERK